MHVTETSPQYHYDKYGAEWTVDEPIDAAYNEIIGLQTSVGGLFGGYYEVTIHFQNQILV